MPDPITQDPVKVISRTVDEPVSAPTEQSGERGRWGRIFGSIVGGVTSVISPNPGTILGSIMRRTGDTQQLLSFQRLIDQSIQHSYNMVMVQKRVQDQSLEVNLVSNLLKTRHDGHMSAVQNIKA
ncbi:MAG: hypothetical protein ACKV2V_07200 [Blastocatellia bacterium]